MPGGETAWVRPVSDAGQRPLGLVRHETSAGASWLFWLRRIRLDVFETEDIAHLVSLTRSWTLLPFWDVSDAEDRYVGRVYPKAIVSDAGHTLGLLEPHGDGGRIVEPAGKTLVTFGPNEGGATQIAFTAPANPFLRMLLLAAVLVLDPKPSR